MTRISIIALFGLVACTVEPDPAFVDPCDPTSGVGGACPAADATDDEVGPRDARTDGEAGPHGGTAIDGAPGPDGCVPAPELCNGLDDDCDGRIDEDFPLGEVCVAGQGGCAAEGRTVCDESGDGVRCDAEPGAPAIEVCNRRDDDCDGETDEGFDAGAACTVGRGICEAMGWVVCLPDGSAACNATPEPPHDEVCDGLDNDCDGVVDDGPGGPLARPCYGGPEETRHQGGCRDGIQRCEGGRFGPCEGQVTPADEVCNAQDDDCDGAADEEIRVPCYSGFPESRNTGECHDGIRRCTDGVLGECEGERLPAEEVCDGLDNDCDGRIDQLREACFGADPALIGVGRCRAGERVCHDGEYTPCRGEILPEPETCDAADNDCDGRVDEDFDLETDPLHCGRCGAACAEGEVCCAGRCRRLDTVEACGDCDNACGRNADRCVVGPDGAACRCGDGAACPGEQRCLDGECRCLGDDDCAADELCCDGVCRPTDPEVQCAACGEPCDPTRASACDDRRCVCGDGAACVAGTFCEPVGRDELRCVGCRDNGDCQAGTLCCNNVCVQTDPDVQCEDCGEPCLPEAADRCIEVGAGEERGGRCVCGESGAPCSAEDGTPFCADGACVQCRDDADCPEGTPRCVDGVCRACNPADHGPCAPDELCCDFRCRPTGAAQQCEACGRACDRLATNACIRRSCRCGDGPPCAGDAVCDDARGVCVQCRADADCAAYPGRPQCVDNVCRPCDPADHAGCGANQLCCGFRCERAGAEAPASCEACGVACSAVAANACVNRDCRCGASPPCGGATPVCDDAAGRCVECLNDGHCAALLGNRDQCVAKTCQVCDPADHAGCAEAGAAPICDAGDLTCRACRSDAECAARPGGRDQCVDGRCEVCDPAGDVGCSGATPICDPFTVQCRPCQADAECVARAGDADLCGDGRCEVCDPIDHAGCAEDGVAPICDADGRVCRACRSDAECDARPGGRDVCDEPRGVCVE